MRPTLALAAASLLIPTLAAAAPDIEFDSVSAGLTGALTAAESSPDDVQELHVTDDGAWLLVTDGSLQYSAGFPATPRYIAEVWRNWANKDIDAVATSPDGNYVVVAEDWRYASPHAPLRSYLMTALNRRAEITDVTFTPDGGWIVLGDGTSSHFLPPAGLAEAIADAESGGRQLRKVDIGPDGSWILVADNWVQTSVPTTASTLRTAVSDMQIDGQSIDHVVLDDDFLSWATISNGSYAGDGSLWDAIEVNLPTAAGSVNLWDRMDQLGIPGLSLAMVNNGIIETRAYGLADTGTGRWLRPSTPMDAASLSKSVAAVGLLDLFEEQGLSMDASLFGTIVPATPGNTLRTWQNLGEVGSLQSWWFGTSNMPTLPVGMTPRHLLSHSANITDGGGSEPQLANASWIPSTLASLAGYGCTMSTGVCSLDLNDMVWWDSSAGPGVTYNYTSDGYLVAEALFEDLVAGGDFDEAMAERILEPFGMDDSSFVQPMEGDWWSDASRTHDEFGAALLNSEEPAWTWGGGGGLMTTPGDLMTMLVAIRNGGDGVVSEATAQAMLTRVISQDPANPTATNVGWYGHGLALNRPNCGADTPWAWPGGNATLPRTVRHGGAHTETLPGNRRFTVRNLMEFHPRNQDGYAIMMSGGAYTILPGPNNDVANADTMQSELDAGLRATLGIAGICSL